MPLKKQLQEKTQKLSAAEQELELILSAIEDCVLLIDSEQNILLASDASGELLGWEREQLLGQHLYRVIRAAEVEENGLGPRGGHKAAAGISSS